MALFVVDWSDPSIVHLPYSSFSLFHEFIFLNRSDFPVIIDLYSSIIFFILIILTFVQNWYGSYIVILALFGVVFYCLSYLLIRSLSLYHFPIWPLSVCLVSFFLTQNSVLIFFIIFWIIILIYNLMSVKVVECAFIDASLFSPMYFYVLDISFHRFIPLIGLYLLDSVLYSLITVNLFVFF